MVAIVAAVLLSSAGAQATSLGSAEGVLVAMRDDSDRTPSVDHFSDQTTEQLQLQLPDLRARHDRIRVLGPILIAGVGVVLLTIGLVVLAENPCLGEGCPSGGGTSGGGAIAALAGLIILPIGLILWIVDSSNRASFERRIDALETEIAARKANAAERSLLFRVTPWSRGGSSGLAFSAQF